MCWIIYDMNQLLWLYLGDNVLVHVTFKHTCDEHGLHQTSDEERARLFICIATSAKRAQFLSYPIWSAEQAHQSFQQQVQVLPMTLLIWFDCTAC